MKFIKRTRGHWYYEGSDGTLYEFWRGDHGWEVSWCDAGVWEAHDFSGPYPTLRAAKAAILGPPLAMGVGGGKSWHPMLSLKSEV